MLSYSLFMKVHVCVFLSAWICVNVCLQNWSWPFFLQAKKLKLGWWICISWVSGEKRGRRRKTERKHKSYGESVVFGEEPFAPRMASHNMNFEEENVQPGVLPHSVWRRALIACVLIQLLRINQGEKEMKHLVETTYLTY